MIAVLLRMAENMQRRLREQAAAQSYYHQSHMENAMITNTRSNYYDD